MAPHIGCNGRQERNVIIISIKETLIFQREVYHSFNNNSCASILRSQAAYSFAVLCIIMFYYFVF